MFCHMVQYWIIAKLCFHQPRLQGTRSEPHECAGNPCHPVPEQCALCLKSLPSNPFVNSLPCPLKSSLMNLNEHDSATFFCILTISHVVHRCPIFQIVLPSNAAPLPVPSVPQAPSDGQAVRALLPAWPSPLAAEALTWPYLPNILSTFVAKCYKLSKLSFKKHRHHVSTDNSEDKQDKHGQTILMTNGRNAAMPVNWTLRDSPRAPRGDCQTCGEFCLEAWNACLVGATKAMPFSITKEGIRKGLAVSIDPHGQHFQKRVWYV